MSLALINGRVLTDMQASKKAGSSCSRPGASRRSSARRVAADRAARLGNDKQASMI
jgi:hypothetical protein